MSIIETNYKDDSIVWRRLRKKDGKNKRRKRRMKKMIRAKVCKRCMAQNKISAKMCRFCYETFEEKKNGDGKKGH